MTVGATGAVGVVQMRRETKWFLHDDALAIEVLDSHLVPEYVRYVLQHAINIGRFEYTAKLYSERLKGLNIEIPLDESGSFDMYMQDKIAKAYGKRELVEQLLKEVAIHLQNVKVEF